MPERIQRKRTKGWKMPDNTIYVGRGTVWGNPFVVGAPSGIFDGKEGRPLGLRDQPEILIPELDLATSLAFYRNAIEGYIKPEMFPFGHQWRDRMQHWCTGHPADMARGFLRGKNLACWCALDRPCHADVLLEIANPATPQVPSDQRGGENG